MHATHQFFLTTRSLYLVVIDARKGEDEGRLHYWLKIVQSYGADSPTAVVINKHEDPNYLDLNENRLQQDHAPNIQAFFKTSCESGTGIVELREWLEQAIRTLPHVADPMPISFFNLKRDLEARNVNYLTFAEYQEACAAHGVDAKAEQTGFLRILHALGSVLNFDDPASPFQELRDTNVLDPGWITDGVYRIINNKELAFAGGVLEMTALNTILTDQERFPPDRYDFIVGMMRKFELCFDFPDTHGQKLLVPELLSPNEPLLNWVAEGALNLEYKYEVLPSGLICRFIVKMNHNLTKPPLYWRSGVVLEIDGNRVLVRSDPQAARIRVSVSGPSGGRRSALAPIRDAFRAIHASIKALEVAEKVPLPEDPSVLLDYKDLIAFERSGVREYPVRLSDGSIVQRNISDLLDGVVTREQRSEEFVDPVETKRRQDQPVLAAEPSREQERRMEANHETPIWERAAIFAIGVAFVATLLGIALFVPDPTDFQIFIFRVVLALGAGAVGALLPGFLEVRFRNWLRAGGAIALFAIVYNINPPALIAQSVTPPIAPSSAAGEQP